MNEVDFLKGTSAEAGREELKMGEHWKKESLKGNSLFLMTESAASFGCLEQAKKAFSLQLEARHPVKTSTVK